MLRLLLLMQLIWLSGCILEGSSSSSLPEIKDIELQFDESTLPSDTDKRLTDAQKLNNEIAEYAGADAINCGYLDLIGVYEDPPELNVLRKCVAEAFDSGKAFYAQVDTSGIDSFLSHAYSQTGTGDGLSYFLDSDPTGGASFFNGTVSRSRCVNPVVQDYELTEYSFYIPLECQSYEYDIDCVENNTIHGESFVFDDISRTGSDALIVSKHGCFGLMDKTGKMLTDLVYDSFESPYRSFSRHDGYALFEQVSPALIFKRNNKYGLLGYDGKELTEAVYNNVQVWSEGRLAVYRDSRWGFVNEDGEEVIAPRCRDVYPFSDGVAACKGDKEEKRAKLNKWGFIDKEGERVIPSQFEFYRDSYFVNGYLIFQTASGYEVYNKKGDILFAGEYEKLFSLDRNKLAGIDEDGLSFINNQGQVVKKIEGARWAIKLTDEYLSVDFCVPPYSTCEENTVIDFDGKILFNAIYGPIYYGIRDRFQVSQRQNNWPYRGIINAANQVLVDTIYRDIYFYEYDSLSFKKSNDWGHINLKTGARIPASSSDYMRFSEGLSRFKGRYTYGFIDEDGNLPIEPKYYDVKDFKNGVAPVESDNGLWGLIDKAGVPIVVKEYEK